MNRRRFILGTLAAPALIRPGLLMPVKPVLYRYSVRTPLPTIIWVDWRINLAKPLDRLERKNS